MRALAIASVYHCILKKYRRDGCLVITVVLYLGQNYLVESRSKHPLLWTGMFKKLICTFLSSFYSVQCENTLSEDRFTNESQGDRLLPLNHHKEPLQKRGAPKTQRSADFAVVFKVIRSILTSPLCLCRLDWRNRTKTLTPCFNK